jgi:hypothetical protein
MKRILTTTNHQTSRSVDPEGHTGHLDSAILDECISVLRLAAQYLGHPDVKAIPFALPSAAVAKRARDAIARVKAACPRKTPRTPYAEKGGDT